MSLRVRLVLLILVVVTLVAFTLSALQLQTLVAALSAQTEDRADLAAQQISDFLIEHINLHSPEYPVPQNVPETRAIWYEIASSDPDISGELKRRMALTDALLEINIASRDGSILASSNPIKVDRELDRLTPFNQWMQVPLYQRTVDLIQRRTPDLEVTVPLGIAEDDETVFTIQVVTSSVLVRDLLIPELQRLLGITGATVAISLLLILAATHRILRPLQRIEQTIDRIAQGQFNQSDNEKPGAKEFRAVQDKLNLLGQQLSAQSEDGITRASLTRGALDQNLDVLMERMSNQLDVANRLAAISRLSGGVAHEIKNPLNAILLRLDLLRARMEAGEEPSELAGEIDVLAKEVVRLDRVVKTFLDFSRPVEVTLADLDLKTLVQEVVDFIRPQADAAGIQVEAVLTGEAAPMRGDEDLLKQALLNLVTNAVEAMQSGKSGAPVGSKLAISLQSSRDEDGEDCWALEISDNGPGIPENKRDKVFQLYFTTKEKGSGIGLAMTYRAVQLHNGTISFRTESGQGTAFRIELPATVAQTAPYGVA